MAIPDTLEINLVKLRDPANMSRRDHIAALLRQILFSEEVTKGPDEEGDWPQDTDWDPAFETITMKKVARKPYRALRAG